MNLYFRSLIVFFASVCLNVERGAADERGQRPPNIVFLLADDLGWTGLRSFGSDLYETPRLDALASSGMMFTSAYSACTVCSPTRASIMTGKYPARLRLTDFIRGQHRPDAPLKIPDWTKRLLPQQVTIAEVLKQSGYRTGHIGKWHLNGHGPESAGTFPTDQGFDVSVETPPRTKGYTLHNEYRSKAGTNYLTDWLTDRACEFIDESKSNPFFLYFAYHVPHTPIEGREDLVKYFESRVDPQATHTNPIYAAMVASLDMSVGRVLDQLAASGVSDNTIVVFTSDNGGLTVRNGKHDGFTENLPLRRGKGSAYEGGVRVPAIIHWPGVTSAGSKTDEPVMTIDYFPTLVEAAGVAAVDVEIDGVSLVPLLRNPTHRFDRNLYWHYPHYHAGGDSPYSAIRSDKYRLVQFHEDNRVELYDLDADIGEQNDLSQTMPQKANALLEELVSWRESVNAQMPTPAKQSPDEKSPQ